MDIIMTGALKKYVKVFIDDILIYSRTLEEHLKHLEDVFARQKEAGLKLKTSKCELLKKENKYLRS